MAGLGEPARPRHRTGGVAQSRLFSASVGKPVGGGEVVAAGECVGVVGVNRPARHRRGGTSASTASSTSGCGRRSRTPRPTPTWTSCLSPDYDDDEASNEILPTGGLLGRGAGVLGVADNRAAERVAPVEANVVESV